MMNLANVQSMLDQQNFTHTSNNEKTANNTYDLSNNGRKAQTANRMDQMAKMIIDNPGKYCAKDFVDIFEMANSTMVRNVRALLWVVKDANGKYCHPDHLKDKLC